MARATTPPKSTTARKWQVWKRMYGEDGNVIYAVHIDDDLETFERAAKTAKRLNAESSIGRIHFYPYRTPAPTEESK